LRHHDPEFGKMCSKRVRQHRLLPDQKRPRTMKHENSLLVGTLDRHKSHVRPGHRLTNRLCISRRRRMISAAKPDEPASNFQQRDNAVPSIATTASLPCSETTVTFTLPLWMTEKVDQLFRDML
jgi:hypothetical protein